MYSFISGNLEEKNENSVVLSTGGVGYELAISANTYENLAAVGENEKLFTYLIVREDVLSLIGFKSKEEKCLFLKLIEISGVGPKAALSILSGGKLSYIVSAIIGGDVVALSKVKGVGKKTAERIVLELKEKLIKQGAFVVSDNFAAVKPESLSDLPQIALDACLGLESLGLTKKESEKIVREVYDIADERVEDIISKALRRL